MIDPKAPEKHPGGWPIKFESVAALQERIEAYFKECDREEETRLIKHGSELGEKIPVIEKGIVIRGQLSRSRRRGCWLSTPATANSSHRERQKSRAPTMTRRRCRPSVRWGRRLARWEICW